MQEGDVIWMAPYCPQWFAAVGEEPAGYIYYKGRQSRALNPSNIQIERLQREIDELALISENPPPVVTRVLFSEADLRARAFVKALCQEAGLAVRGDAMANTFARWEGAEPAAPAMATGSHIDAIPNAGKYDGVVGVLGAIEAVRALRRDGFRPRRAIELIIFTAEEPTRFGIGCLGSRWMAGTLSEERLAALRDPEGQGLEYWRQRAGLNATGGAGHYAGFVELHIEQGPNSRTARVGHWSGRKDRGAERVAPAAGRRGRDMPGRC